MTCDELLGLLARLRRASVGGMQLVADPGTLAATTRLLLDLQLHTSLAAMICDAVGLDLAVLELAWLVLRLMILHRPTRLAGSRIRVMRIPA